MENGWPHMRLEEMRRKLPPLTHTVNNDSKRERKWQRRRENEEKVKER